MSALWSAGRYEAVGERIAPLAKGVVDAVARRIPLRDAAVVDLACGTGSAAISAAGLGATVTGVDVTPELIEIAKRKADALGHTVTWMTADAGDTGLGAQEYDAVVSNMGIIFVEPTRQIAELARLLKPAGILGFSAWQRSPDLGNPFFDPIVEVLGVPPARSFTPDQWGQPETVEERLTQDFDDIEIAEDVHTWRFSSVDDAVAFVTDESPMHVDIVGRLEDGQRAELVRAFRAAFGEHVDDLGSVLFGARYVIVTARRR